MTLSLGVRYDYYSSSFPDQPVGPGELVPARNFVIPAQDGVRGWHDVTPKFGVVYDLFGDGKTALRGTANSTCRVSRSAATFPTGHSGSR